MKILKLSDAVYERLKDFVVDPFDDTPDSVLSRLLAITAKARSRWSSFEDSPIDEPRESREEELLEEVI
jgi:hypothetical protein